MNILYVSYCVPYDKAYNAGAQSLNFYIKKLVAEKNVSVKVIAYSNENDAKEIEQINTKINYDLIIRPKGVRRFVGRITSINSKYNPNHKYCNLMTRYSADLLVDRLKEINNNGYTPDVIFLEWTQIVLLVNRIRKIFPLAHIIASEPDVTYLSFMRKYKNENVLLKKIYKKNQYHNCIKREMDALKKCDYIFVQSNRDKKLVTDKVPELEGKIGIQKPFYHKSQLPHNRCNNDILFFGSMGRAENIQAAKWFINNVMPLIMDIPCRFVVIGSGITDELKRYVNDRIVMKGFVLSIDEEFSKAMCFVCPLLIGAGTKVKVLESLYSGIPVLTNNIGIEGINAVDGVDYLHCESPADYSKGIRSIYENELKVNGKSLIERDFSLEESYNNYLLTIKGLI